jgi:thiamine-monophosphate kinase
MTASEANLIRKLRTAAPRSGNRAAHQSGIALGIGDDAALFRPRHGYETVLTCDWFLEGTHFLRDKHPADSVGWKCLARAVSDIAAMGAEPRCFLLSLALPESLTGGWLDQFLSGLRRATRKLHCPLAGGDTTRQSKVLINITVVGEVRANLAALRSGARPGDLIYVSGRLGSAQLGL